MSLAPLVAFANIKHNRRLAVILQELVHLLRSNFGNLLARFGHNILKTLGHDSSSKIETLEVQAKSRPKECQGDVHPIIINVSGAFVALTIRNHSGAKIICREQSR